MRYAGIARLSTYNPEIASSHDPYGFPAWQGSPRSSPPGLGRDSPFTCLKTCSAALNGWILLTW